MALLVDDMPTLRLVTLRRLVRQAIPPVVLAQDARVVDVERALRLQPGTVAVLVDRSNVLQGTLRLGDLDRAGGDQGERAAHLMRPAPVLEAEHDIEAARAAMSMSGTDRVVVIGTSGELLGVLTDGDVRVRSRAA